ncbi:A24 family peptidase [bacterium]|nr:A24 family peptidase [bacterium]
MPAYDLLAAAFGAEFVADPLFFAFLASAAFAFGAVIGSFLNVCVARLPAMSLVHQYRKGNEAVRRELAEAIDEDAASGRARLEEMVRENVNLSRPRSRCPNCKNPVAWYDNVPIASWLVLHARCRHCAERISPVYPLVELASGLFAAYALLAFGPIVGPIYFLVFAALVVVTGVDLLIFEIPDEVVLPGTVIGLVAVAVLPISYTDALVGIALGAGVPYALGKIYLLIAKKEGMGFGDVKLLAMIGAFFGWRGVLVTLLIASLTGSIVGISLMIARRHRRGEPIPFGPFLALGAFVHMNVGPQLLDWYLTQFRG